MEKKRKSKLNNLSRLSAEEQQKEPNAEFERIKKDLKEIALYQAKRENLLLGEFSSDGKYSLSDETLMQELVSMPKVLQERMDNVVYAYTKFKEHHLNFKVELDISESYCKAELFLIETEQTAQEDIKHLTSLGNFVEMYSPSFKEHVYKTWNINLQETPFDKDSVVFETLKVLAGEYNFSKELFEILSQLYIVRMLKLLENCGTLGLKIQADYRALVEELLKKDPSLAQDYIRLKQILDFAIAKNKGMDTILAMPGGAEIVKNFSEPINRVRGENAPIYENPRRPETKEEKTVVKNEEKPKKKKSKSKPKSDDAKPKIKAGKDKAPQVLADIDPLKFEIPIIVPVVAPPTKKKSVPQILKEEPLENEEIEPKSPEREIFNLDNLEEMSFESIFDKSFEQELSSVELFDKTKEYLTDEQKISDSDLDDEKNIGDKIQSDSEILDEEEDLIGDNLDFFTTKGL